jgi:glucose dehydrogenase
VISSANVASLQQAWTFRLPASLVTSGPGFGSITATPIVANGVVYLQDLGNNVYALDLATGKVKWEYRVSRSMPEPARPYGSTRTCSTAVRGAFGIEPQVALNRDTGTIV